MSGAAFALSGNTDTAAVLRLETLKGTVQTYAVESDFNLADILPGTYRLTLSAPHHTTFTLEDATWLHATDLGELTLYNGDANGDGVVDIADITSVLQADCFGTAATVPTAPRDINDDGMIDIKDVNQILLAENYGGSDVTIIY